MKKSKRKRNKKNEEAEEGSNTARKGRVRVTNGDKQRKQGNSANDKSVFRSGVNQGEGEKKFKKRSDRGPNLDDATVTAARFARAQP